MPEEKAKLKEMLIQSLYDYHHANNGASYRLPKAMLEMDPNSEQVINEILAEDYATDAGQGTDALLLSITKKGMEYIEGK